MPQKLETQIKLDAEFPTLEVGQLVQELRSRSGSMPKIAIDTSWIMQGACLGEDPNIFFPVNGAGVKQAKALCARCPVRNECLEYALLNQIEHGVWGGASERQRGRILRERRNLLKVA